MPNRLTQDALYDHCPRVVTHLLALGKVEPQSDISAKLQHLVKLRVSQINHCCFCQHMHSQEARQDGELQERLDVLPAWREAPCFSDKERAALAWAEALTQISSAPVSDAVYQDAIAQFSESALIELTTIILEINSWNRISTGFQFAPDMQASAAQ